jgi:hypothetical protein
MTKSEIYNTAFNYGKDGLLSASEMPAHLEQYSEDFDSFETWVEGWNSGANYASHAAAETCDSSDRWLHEEDYLEWRDHIEG